MRPVNLEKKNPSGVIILWDEEVNVLRIFVATEVRSMRQFEKS